MTDNMNGLEVARRLADWYVKDQVPVSETNPYSGAFHFQVFPPEMNHEPVFSSEWELAFPIMGLMSASKVFQDEIYLKTARGMMSYLKTLQVLDPFHPQHYGAFRENTPQTTWCYTRDALSAAWGCLEYYRFCQEEEYLERAILWAKWFLKNGLDETGWPIWGVQIDEPLPGTEPTAMRLDVHGSFQTGALNFFYKLYQVTQDKSWTGAFFEHIADYACSHIQQPSGAYSSVAKATGKVPEDPQGGLHRINDDLGSLGLLCAFQVYRKPAYLQTVERYLRFVFQNQRADGHFEDSCACIPLILNTIDEARSFLDVSAFEAGYQKALYALYARQFPADSGIYAGGLMEQDGVLCSRSMGYALIYLLKHFGGDNRFFTIGE